MLTIKGGAKSSGTTTSEDPLRQSCQSKSALVCEEEMKSGSEDKEERKASIEQRFISDVEAMPTRPRKFITTQNKLSKHGSLEDIHKPFLGGLNVTLPRAKTRFDSNTRGSSTLPMCTGNTKIVSHLLESGEYVDMHIYETIPCDRNTDREKVLKDSLIPRPPALRSWMKGKSIKHRYSKDSTGDLPCVEEEDGDKGGERLKEKLTSIKTRMKGSMKENLGKLRKPPVLYKRESKPKPLDLPKVQKQRPVIKVILKDVDSVPEDDASTEGAKRISVSPPSQRKYHTLPSRRSLAQDSHQDSKRLSFRSLSACSQKETVIVKPHEPKEVYKQYKPRPLPKPRGLPSEMGKSSLEVRPMSESLRSSSSESLQPSSPKAEKQTITIQAKTKERLINKQLSKEELRKRYRHRDPPAKIVHHKSFGGQSDVGTRSNEYLSTTRPLTSSRSHSSLEGACLPKGDYMSLIQKKHNSKTGNPEYETLYY